MSEKEVGKHTPTPGPWFASVGGCKDHTLEDTLGCATIRTEDGIAVPRTVANLMLQAAAPDLLAQLKIAHERFICGGPDNCIKGCDVAAAIAKAEGRS